MAFPGTRFAPNGGLRRLRRADWRRDRWRWTALAALLLFLGVLGSIMLSRLDARNSSNAAKLAFHGEAGSIASTLKLAIQHEQDLVINGAAFIAANPHSSNAQFLAWTRSVKALARYPEVQGVGFVVIVPASQLKAFAAHVLADRPAGASFKLVPPGKRPFYCLGAIGLQRGALGAPPGQDFCADGSTALLVTRDTGVGVYYPIQVGFQNWLGVSTPVYRGNRVPATVPARRAAFLGWIGEGIDPTVVLESALQGHTGQAVSLRYLKGGSDVAFTSGPIVDGMAKTTIDLGNGWHVKVMGFLPAGGVFRDSSALIILLSGSALSLLLGLLLFVLATGRARALQLVNEKTLQLSHQALHDELTDLPNRALLLDRAEQLLARNRREPERVISALFIDIDGFKDVNDSYGHATGDHVLTVVAQRLQHLLREQDTVGRLGGDEFVVLLDSNTPEISPDLIAQRTIEALGRPIPLPDGDRSVTISASVGIAIGLRSTADGLIRDADYALYEAKALGKDRYAIFEPRMHEAAQGRLVLQAELAEALEREQFFLAYQPTFDLGTGDVLGVEALIRWRHPTLGTLQPDSFIPVAEETGLISAIGHWVLGEACRQLAAWQKAGHSVGVSVNVSAYQLDRDGFAADVQQTLAESGIDPASLTLEITETALMHDVPAAARRLGALKALGVRLAIDDFGTGYSALAYLRQFPVDALKIDRSFISNVATSTDAAAIIHALVQLGKTLQIETLAEGIEDSDQLAQLQREQCDQGQGFLFARPLAPEAVEEFLRSAEEGATSKSGSGAPHPALDVRRRPLAAT